METYGLLGYPLGHSFSRGYFTDKFQKEGLNAQYLNFEIPCMDEVKQVLEDHPELKGMNVTIPYKQQIIPLLDELSQEAQAIGAVNVVRVSREAGKVHLKGFNSDVIGFCQSIKPLLKPEHRKALILGCTGGASKAVRYGLEQKLGLQVLGVSRRAAEGSITYADITPELLQEYTVIVNCTPSGMFPHVDECPMLPYEALDSRHLLFDLIYNPDQTLFLKKGAQQGATTKNGLKMLILQALASWEFWHGAETLTF